MPIIPRQGLIPPGLYTAGDGEFATPMIFCDLKYLVDFLQVLLIRVANKLLFDCFYAIPLD